MSSCEFCIGPESDDDDGDNGDSDDDGRRCTCDRVCRRERESFTFSKFPRDLAQVLLPTLEAGGSAAVNVAAPQGYSRQSRVNETKL